MAWSVSDLFPPWGDSGERPSDNFQYDGGDQVNEKHFDYLWTQVNKLENEVRSALTDIDSDKDGQVDAADIADDGQPGFAIDGARVDHDWYSSSETGTIQNGNAGLLWQTELADQETLYVTQAGMVKGDGTAAPSGVDLIIADLTNGVSEVTLISADGNTIYDDETGTPYGSYTNTSGAPEHVAVLADNGHYNSGSGSKQDLQAGFIGRVN